MKLLNSTFDFFFNRFIRISNMKLFIFNEIRKLKTFSSDRSEDVNSAVNFTEFVSLYFRWSVLIACNGGQRLADKSINTQLPLLLDKCAQIILNGYTPSRGKRVKYHCGCVWRRESHVAALLYAPTYEKL